MLVPPWPYFASDSWPANASYGSRTRSVQAVRILTPALVLDGAWGLS
jgi:hypothetical protein